MKSQAATVLAVLVAAVGCPLAAAQQAAAPSFAAPNLTPQGVRSLAATCAACHGTNGHVVRGSPVEALAGRRADEIVRLMQQFRSGTKPATLMHQISKGYSDAEIAALADYFSKQPR